MTPEPYTIDIPQADLDDLHGRLAHTRWPDQVTGADWDYGADRDTLKAIVEHWADGFDWRAQEKRLNQRDHYRADLEGFGIHFIHQRATFPSEVVPLLVLHGWPSSFVQMLPILDLLTDPESHGGETSDGFDVVVPSLPGYGFSDRPAEPGMNLARIGEILHALMTDTLGYDRYAIRSSDLGAGVAGALALAHPDAIIGTHMSGTNPFLGPIPDDLSPAEEQFVARAQEWTQNEMAYAQQHTTKPQTVAYGLNDSPAGLAAWILEKFQTWSDGGLDAFERDDLLTNLSVYWFTQTIGSSVRLYYESMRSQGGWGQPDIPTALAMLPADMFPTPQEWAERSSRIDRWTDLPRGGHFAEWEVPDLLAADIGEFFRPLRS